jgi:hypothetical protein
MSKTIKSLVSKASRKVALKIRRLTSSDSVNPIYSNLDEQSIINGYLKTLILEGRHCIDIAASDGLSMSNTYSLYKDGWGGLAVECDAQKFSSLASSYVNFPNVNLAKCMVTPKNILSLLAANEIPERFEFLNLDIDGYDYFVLEQILGKYRPKLICTEINEKIPPPIKFTVKWNPKYAWAEDHFYGQSISQLHYLATKHRYALIELHYNNAFLMPLESSPKASLTPEEAYQTGYSGKPDRKEKFPWNENMEDVLHMKPDDALIFVNNFFSKYKGMFDASI